MKTLAWISGIIAVIMVIFAFIMWLGLSPFLGVAKSINYIHVANTAVLFTIAFILCEKKE